jgi:hypothetical protein
MDMTWEQKLAALDALAGQGTIAMRKPGDWLCSHRLSIKDQCILKGGCGNGATPQDAIEDQWSRLTEKLARHELIVIDEMKASRRAFRWNGFMWREIDEPMEAA